MPVERRRILFSDDEIIAATLSHCRATGIAIPEAEVEELDVDTESGCGLTLTFAVSSPEQFDEISIDPDTLMLALIALCRLYCIPLPRAASKRIERKDGALSMVFVTDRARGSVNCSVAA